MRPSTDGEGVEVDQDPIFLSPGRGRYKRISGRFVHARNSSVFTQSLSISEASQVNISAIGTPTVVKLTPLTPSEMTNTFIFMVLFTKVHSEVRKWRKSSFFVDFAKKSQRLRSRKITQKYPILNQLASPEAWDNSPTGVSWFCTCRGPLRSPKLWLKQKST